MGFDRCAEKLTATIQSNPPLGSLVRVLAEPTARPFNVTWYLPLVGLCPNLIAFAFTYPPRFRRSELEAALLAVVELEQLGIKVPAFFTRTEGSIFLNTSRLPACRNIKRLAIDLGEQSDRPDLVSSLKLPLVYLDIKGRHVTSSEIHHFLPIDMSALKDFVVSWVKLTPTEMLSLLKKIEPATEVLSIGSASFEPINHLHYRDHRLAELPLEPFHRFRVLQGLTLKRFRGPSLELLKLLNKYCPYLGLLSFDGCFWIPDYPVSLMISDEEYFSHAFPQEAIIQALRPFPWLTNVSLGYLRHSETRKAGPYHGVTEALRLRGIDCDWLTWLPDLARYGIEVLGL